MMLTVDPQRQSAIERRTLMQTIAKAESRISRLRRFAELPPETVAAVKEEASDMGRRAYDALDGKAIQIAACLEYAVHRAKRHANAEDWQTLRKAQRRLDHVIAQQPLSGACDHLELHLRCVEAQRQYQETMARLRRMEDVTGLTDQLYARIMVEHGPARGDTIH
jgi:ParB-like chromosome segregation protein Spo0J